MHTWMMPLLFAAGLTGGFIDAVAGGGGLISVPALLATGMDPRLALGTNKLQSSCGTALAVWRYARAGLMQTPGLALAAGCAFTASVGGAVAVSRTDPDFLKKLVPWLLAAVAVYTWVKRDLGRMEGRRRLGWPTFAVSAGLTLGFYDGFFGPGTGSFWMVACLALIGLDLRQATGYTKACNLASNAGSLIFFLLAGHVAFVPGLIMAAGQLIGARLGSGLVITRGAAFIRPVFLAVVMILTVKLIRDGFFN